MGLMASVASHPAGVLPGDHLRERRGFGGILLVAAAAEVGDIGQFGLDCGGVIGMLGLRPVASFAGNAGVLAGGADFRLIVVTQNAGALPRISNGSRPDQCKGAGPVMAELAKGLRDDGAADNQENAENGQQDHRGTYQMDPVSKSATHGHPLRMKFDDTRSNMMTKRPFDTGMGAVVEIHHAEGR